MTLNEWIVFVGGVDRAADVLRLRPRTVASWYRFERVPEIAMAANIVLRTNGRVDYNGIYAPIAANRKGSS